VAGGRGARPEHLTAMGLLDDIRAQKTREIAALRAEPAPVRPADLAVRNVVDALLRPPGAALRLIGEVKLRSPSAGALSQALSPRERAKAYQLGGAAMVSVLTDARWFDGSLDHLRAAREEVGIPLLCKEFILDPIQIDHAWAAGADAVLIIVRFVPESQSATLAELVTRTRARGIEPLVEVVDERELERALAVGARVIGVNARDLDKLEMDAARAARVLASIPEGRIAVHLSGVKSGSDAARIASSRADAALIGEALMRCDDPGRLLAELVAGASGPGSRTGKN